MNERLRELLKQSTVDNPYGGCVHYDVDHSKFAQLIIQECKSQIALIGISNYDNEDIAWSIDTALKLIDSHFNLKQHK